MGSNLDACLVDRQDPAIRQAVWEILVEIDHEFVPPLSQRHGTTEARFSQAGSPVECEGPVEYYQQIIEQNIVLVHKDALWIGLLSFRQGYLLESIWDLGPCNYVTTIGVRPGSRGLGVARVMYNFVLSDLPAPYTCPIWATRTWSSNHHHISLLQDLGFKLAATIKDHRAPGVDTLYYVRDSAALTST
ncbi:MAG: GNAT family N-acetyltransferase [Anaerolineales bacterium]|nr:GNAT family N-acetyltransferase [Anaerolineales bacterium]